MNKCVIELQHLYYNSSFVKKPVHSIEKIEWSCARTIQRINNIKLKKREIKNVFQKMF